MNLHDVKMIGLNGSLQSSRSLTHGFLSRVGNWISMGLISWATVRFVAVPRSKSFFRQLVDKNDQQDHHDNADHRSRPHPAAHPAVGSRHGLVPSFLFAVGRPSGNSLEKSVGPRTARLPIIILRWGVRLRYGVKPHRGIVWDAGVDQTRKSTT
ncbi:MAG: hypothetical protein Q8M83_02960 [bacterium]|nr:hypothetical protein [bacterium]